MDFGDSKSGGPRRLSSAIGAILAKYGVAATSARSELENTWKVVAGPELASRTVVGSFKRGVLEILVDDPILLQELNSFRKPELLQQLQVRLLHSKLTTLRFRRK